MIFFLDYNKIYKNSAFDIVESQSKEIRLVSYIARINQIAQVSF